MACTVLCVVVLFSVLLAPLPSSARASPAPAEVLPWDATTTVSTAAATRVTTASPQKASAEDRGRKQDTPENLELPPRIFYPPTQPDVPMLVTSAANFLEFEYRLKCSDTCPTMYTWRFRKKVDIGDQPWEECKSHRLIGFGNEVRSVVNISGLETNTSYEVQAHPVLINKQTNQPQNWYHNLPTSPFTPPATGMTCDVEQEGVREVKVHSAGSKWLALSWFYPMPVCNTLLQYRIRYKSDLQRGWSGWRNVGYFWTNATWSVHGDVKPCYLWPDRHCYLLSNGYIVARKKYMIEIQVEREGDRRKSYVQSIQGETKSFQPSRPEKLRCVESRSTSLSLSWSSPLEPGGELTKVVIHINDTNDNVVKKEDKKIEMRPYYEEKVSGLEPATLYKIMVMFVSADGLDGVPAKLETWTSPDEKGQVGGSCYEGSPANSSMYESAAAASGAREATNDTGSWWPWLLVALLIITVAVGFFVLGQRCPKEVSWKVVRLSKGCSSNSSEGSTGLSKRDLEHGSGDLEALCIGASGSSKGTPPSSIADYAESSGYAVISSPTVVTPQSFSCRNQYAEPKNVLEEQPYAEALDARGPQPPPLYTEVRSCATPSPVNNTPVYAEVDKKRRLPPPPPKVPPLPQVRPPFKIPPPVPAKPVHLQDSD